MLSTSSSYKYLVLNLSSDLSWSSHIYQIVKNANPTLGVVKRNLKLVKLLAHTSLVRPKIEYASSIWDSYLMNLTYILESVQNRAHHHNSVSLTCRHAANLVASVYLTNFSSAQAYACNTSLTLIIHLTDYITLIKLKSLDATTIIFQNLSLSKQQENGTIFPKTS